MNYRNPRKNNECYSDLTAYQAIKKTEEDERFKKLLNTIFYLCDLAGFRFEGRIRLVDKKTNKVWK